MLRDTQSRCRRRARLDELTDALEHAGVYGRGGAGFPTATKLRALAAQRGRPIVVVNAAEGEPLSKKDRYLLSNRADTVLDGAFVAADVLGSEEIVIGVDQQMRSERMTIARAAQARAGSSRSGPTATVQLVPPGYVTGQETALLSALGGRPAKPTLAPPYPFERGLDGRPTLVFNAETYSHIGRVARGTYDGTRLITVAGAVANPGLVEIGPGTSIAGVLESIGGVTENVRSVLLGGYGGTWARLGELEDIHLDERTLRERGLTLGAGIIFLLGDSACPVAETVRVTRWMAGESAGQCGPCVHGLNAIAGALEELTLGRDNPAVYNQVRRWSAMVKQRGACAHPDGVARFVTTALDTFAAEFSDHARHGSCDLCAAPASLPTPSYRRAQLKTDGTQLRTPQNDFWREAAIR